MTVRASALSTECASKVTRNPIFSVRGLRPQDQGQWMGCGYHHHRNREVYALKACTGHKSSGLSPLFPGGGSDHASQQGWLRWVQDCTVGSHVWLQCDPWANWIELHLKHEVGVIKAGSSLTHFAEEVATRYAVLTHFSSTCAKGWRVWSSSMLGLLWLSEDVNSEPISRRGTLLDYGSHCAIVGPQMSTKYFLQLQHIDVFFHMGHPTLPHCLSSRGVGICGDSLPVRLNRAYKDTLSI